MSASCMQNRSSGSLDILRPAATAADKKIKNKIRMEEDMSKRRTVQHRHTRTIIAASLAAAFVVPAEG